MERKTGFTPSRIKQGQGFSTNAVACPACGSTKGGVLDTRPVDGTIRRQRACGSCLTRFTTLEHVVDLSALRVIPRILRGLADAQEQMERLHTALGKRSAPE